MWASVRAIRSYPSSHSSSEPAFIADAGVIRKFTFCCEPKVIQNYFDGWLTGDTTLVGSAMHSTCNLKYVRDGKISKRNRTEYLSGFKPRPRLENAEGRILSIDITRTAAEAKVELETENRLFTDYFNLLKEEDRWYITDKVSTNISKK